MLVQNLDKGIGWKKLATTLRTIQNLINRNDPVKGEGIKIDETDSGSIISVEPKTSDDPAPNSGAGTQVTNVDGWVMLTFEACLWTDVTVVNPADCSQTTKKFLEFTGQAGDFAVARTWITLNEVDPSHPPPSINITLPF